MSLNIDNYINKTPLWYSLIDYVCEVYPDAFSKEDDHNKLTKSLKEFLKNNSKAESFGSKASESFRKFIDNCANGGGIYRDNMYRLIFALKIQNTDEAQRFCQKYLHLNELSARSLSDFIILSAVKLHMTYKQAMELIDDESIHRAIIEMPYKPATLKNNVTTTMYRDICNKINSEDDLISYINMNKSLFAQTRNTLYRAFFEEVDLEALICEFEYPMINSAELKDFFELHSQYAPDANLYGKDYSLFTDDDWNKYYFNTLDNGLSYEFVYDYILYINGIDVDKTVYDLFSKKEKIYQDPRLNPNERKKEWERYILEYEKDGVVLNPQKKGSLHNIYLNIFSLVGDTFLNTESDALSESEISILCKSKGNSDYSSAFISYNTFENIFWTRKSSSGKDSSSEVKDEHGITAEVFLLNFIYKKCCEEDGDFAEANLDDTDFDYKDAKSVLKTIDDYLYSAGFASLNEYNCFDRLFKDTIIETLEDYNTDDDFSPYDFWNTFIANFRGYIKQIVHKL